VNDTPCVKGSALKFRNLRPYVGIRTYSNFVELNHLLDYVIPTKMHLPLRVILIADHLRNLRVESNMVVQSEVVRVRFEVLLNLSREHMRGGLYQRVRHSMQAGGTVNLIGDMPLGAGKSVNTFFFRLKLARQQGLLNTDLVLADVSDGC
jgi:hypothetical protein